MLYVIIRSAVSPLRAGLLLADGRVLTRPDVSYRMYVKPFGLRVGRVLTQLTGLHPRYP